ncbi:MAG: hypothetical protein WA964_18735 [Ilumatobacter sp.]|uniref:hypothetical protein n=1 Tax=Ilumatobacter sp. TaxID=1967498 RepID=UPI003C786C4D
MNDAARAVTDSSGVDPDQYVIGVMRTMVEDRDREGFEELVQRATSCFEQRLTDGLGLRVDLFGFDGPHVVPTDGAYAPLDFVRIGLSEKLERDVHFLLIVTEVDLSATSVSFALALPSQLTNVGVISTRRLDPAFWGDEPQVDTAVERLAALMFHTFGHLLNLDHHAESTNVMYDVAQVEELDLMADLTSEQFAQIRRQLPREARERVSERGGSQWSFVMRVLRRNAGPIATAVGRANPARMVGRLPTMLAAALSIIIVLFFSPEMWDVASTVDFYQLMIFALAAIFGSTFVLYRAFAFGNVLRRDRLLSESGVVTEAATIAALLLTMATIFALFAGAIYLGIVTIFPRRLMETWPTVDPAVRSIDHLKMAMLISGLGVLAGSLGGRVDGKALVRGVLFLDEET